MYGLIKKKKPVGKEWNEFVDRWHNTDHDGKLFLAEAHGVTYDTAKHWISESGATVPKTAYPPRPIPPRPNSPLAIQTKKEMTTFAVLGDTHNPYQDSDVLMAVEEFLKERKPDVVVYNGDINDFYQVSSFAKDPSRLSELQSDIDVTTTMFDRHRNIMPDAEFIFVEGTHENRWFKYLQDRAPAVSALRGASITELYGLNERGIDYIPFEQGLLINGVFLILHGDIASVHSAYTAKRHFEKHGGCGIANHTHRGGSFYKRDRFGTWGWWENFCLCRLDPDWIANPNWQQGFSLVHFTNDDRFWVEQIPIIHNRFMYGGKLYG